MSIFGGLTYLLQGGGMVGQEGNLKYSVDLKFYKKPPVGYQLMSVSMILASIFGIGISICFWIGIDKVINVAKSTKN